jgi:hypothetical protein
MKTNSRAPSATIIYCVIVATVMLGISASAQSRDDAESAEEGMWQSEARVLIRRISALAEHVPEPTLGNSYVREMITSRQEIDEIIWSLWLITGLPPKPRSESEESLRNYATRMASLYEKYVNDHRQLGKADVDRLGLENAVNAIGSPLWYMALKYVENKTGMKDALKVTVRQSPESHIVDLPLDNPSYKKLSSALKTWYDTNKANMIWRTKEGRFVPKDGKYVGIDSLERVITDVSFSRAVGEELPSNPR